MHKGALFTQNPLPPKEGGLGFASRWHTRHLFELVFSMTRVEDSVKKQKIIPKTLKPTLAIPA